MNLDKEHKFDILEEPVRDNKELIDTKSSLPNGSSTGFIKGKYLLIGLLAVVGLMLLAGNNYQTKKLLEEAEKNNERYLNLIQVKELEQERKVENLTREAMIAEQQEKLLNLQLKAITTAEEERQANITALRPLVLYVYHETESARTCALFFIKHGLNAEADFIFVINGESDIELSLPQNASNVKFIKRENKCYDLGSMGVILRANGSELVKKYKRFILLNDSIRGPFLPTWATGCWTDKFLSKITNEVKLVGITYNCQPTKHVQSMFLATDDVGIKIFLAGSTTDLDGKPDYELNPRSLAGFSTCPETMHFAISNEMSLTNLIYRAGYKVAVLMTAIYSQDNYYQDCNNEEMNVPQGYFGSNIHPYETIFFKADRSIDDNLMNKLTEWHDRWNYSSWDACAAAAAAAK